MGRVGESRRGRRWRGRAVIVAVLIAPFATATQQEQESVRRVQRVLIGLGRIPVWFPDVLCPLLNDDDPEERAVALRASEEFVRFVAAGGGEAHVVGDRVTEGMDLDLKAWKFETNEPVTRHPL